MRPLPPVRTLLKTIDDVNGDPDRAGEILAANRIGMETLADYNGSDLLLSVARANVRHRNDVGAAELPDRAQGTHWRPSVLRARRVGPREGAVGGPVVRTFAGIAFGIGATLVALRLFSDVDLGFLLPVGIVLLAAGLLIGTTAHPWSVFHWSSWLLCHLR